MRCIIVGAPMENDDILYDIGEYFWNAGHEVLIRNSEFNCPDIQMENEVIHKSQLIILVQSIYNSSEKLNFSNYFKSFFDHSFVQKVGGFMENIEQNAPSSTLKLPNYHDVPVILLSSEGIYSSNIPYPNKLYSCTQMNKQNFDDFLQKISHMKAFFIF